MKYNKIEKGFFVDRPNRFIAHVKLKDRVETVHVKNTGRCKELLQSGCVVYLEKSDNPNRKTEYDLVAVEKKRNGKEDLLINMDSQAPNEVVAEWLEQTCPFGKDAVVRREVTCGKSRFDFYIETVEKTWYLEVKGCTLETDGVAYFPDAPTERGIKHIQELTQLSQKGIGAVILFVVQMKEMKEFRPNDETHPAFGEALRAAKRAGVKIMAIDCIVTENSLQMDEEIPVIL